MSIFDIFAPAFYIAAAIAVVALVYLGFSLLKDRSDRLRDEELEAGCSTRRRKR